MRKAWRRFVDHFIPSKDNHYKPHVLGKKWLIFFLTVVLTSEGILVASVFAKGSLTNMLAAVLPGEIISLTNSQRAANSVGSLAENPQLDAAAQAKANDMAAKGYFSHVGPDGKTPWAWISDAGYDYQYAGENLAVRFNDSTDVVQAWMASPTHKANIVKPQYTETGVGVARGLYKGELATYVVQYFGAPRVGEVLGTSTSVVATPQTPIIAPRQGEPTPQSMLKQLLRLSEAPPSSVFWILGAVAAFIIVALGLAFVIHIEIQSTEMLASGVVVAAVALSFLYLNQYFPVDLGSAQSATVRLFAPSPDIAIDDATSTVPAAQ
jgi:hypothetical protein